MGEIDSFSFSGELSASKSILNRLLIVQSYFPQLRIKNDSLCEDVRYLKNCLLQMESDLQCHFDCGAGGTTYRFFLSRLSRKGGEYVVSGDERLFTRPHRALYNALIELGTRFDFETPSSVRVMSDGWSLEKPITVDCMASSQFASSLLLNAWELKQDLHLNLINNQSSTSYLMMTIELLRSLGMQIIEKDQTLIVPAHQSLGVESYSAEPDMSSAFSLACCAAANGEIELKSFPENSLQPDFIFIDLLREMKIPFSYNNESKVLSVKASETIEPLELNLKNQPDLFPVLAVLLTRANGTSVITGLDKLGFKESDRVSNIQDLICSLGFKCSYQNKKFTIQGSPQFEYRNEVEVDPDQDHRIAMAAGLAALQGAPVTIKNKQVVNKSFPEFWDIIGL